MGKESVPFLPGMSPEERSREAYDRKAREGKWKTAMIRMNRFKNFLPHFVTVAADAQRMDPEKFLEEESIVSFITKNWERVMDNFREQKRYLLNDAQDLNRFIDLAENTNAVAPEGFHISDFFDGPTWEKIAELLHKMPRNGTYALNVFKKLYGRFAAIDEGELRKRFDYEPART